MKAPYFSIIIPTHQRAPLLRRTIASLRENDFKDIQLIVVADECDADTMAVAAEGLSDNDLFVKRNGPKGPAGSRNLGMDLAQGQRVIFLDDDDGFMPDYLGKMHEACEAHPHEVLYGNFRIIEEDRSQLHAPPISVQDYSVEDLDPEMIYVRNFIHNHTTVFPRYMLQGKRQDASLSSLDDWDFLLSIKHEYPVRHCPILGAIIYKDRVTPGIRRGTSQQAKDATVISDYLSIYKKWRAPTEALKLERQKLLTSVGFTPPLEWL